jgi:hypothetical protein
MHGAIGVASKIEESSMPSMSWKLAMSAAALVLWIVPVAGEELRPSELAAFPNVPATGDLTDVTSGGTAGAAGPARDFRVLWADPAIKDYVGISENEWDFNKPDGVPGFGSLSRPGAAR